MHKRRHCLLTMSLCHHTMKFLAAKVELSVDIIFDKVDGVDCVSEYQTLARVEIAIREEGLAHVFETLLRQIRTFFACT